MEKIKGIILLLIMTGAILAVSTVKEQGNAYERIREEEELILQYLEETEKEEIIGPEERTEYWEDAVWFQKDGVMYTPEFAKGTLDAVLEIEKIKLRRGIYKGTREEMLHNLDVWMLVAARPDYRLGETHYCIYGHNCVGSGQEISMNRLQELVPGDLFVLTTKRTEYQYEVTSVYGRGREEVTKKLADNFLLPADRCYLITCGRGEYRYLDLVVEGTLVKTEEK